MASDTYTLYYWTESKDFLGRSIAPLALLEQQDASYVVKAPGERPPGGFAVPMVVTPKGACVSQVACIMHTLGHELNLAPTDFAADAKALQCVTHSSSSSIMLHN